MKRVLLAILGGGDWSDASVDHITVQADVDLVAAREAYNTWYREVYCPALHRSGYTRPCPITYMNFVDYLKAHYGAVDATVNDIMVIEEC
jgi:hypothetical protein